MASPQWRDVSVRLTDGLIPWPGDPPFHREVACAIARGDVCNFSTLAMSAHAGTHMDAPLHYLQRGASIDRLPLAATVGPARVISIRNRHAIEVDELRRYRIRKGERVLFKTRNSERRRPGIFFKDYVSISPDAASYLASRQLRSVGIDGPSVGAFERGAETHRLLLGAGIWVIEWLDLSHTAPGTYDLICLPLRVVGGDGAPARAILRLRRPAILMKIRPTAAPTTTSVRLRR